jgi:hypothetical protein
MNKIKPAKKRLKPAQTKLPANAFVGRSKPPSNTELAAALGPAKTVWDQLNAELADECVLADHEWNSYLPNAGWALRLKRDQRNIVYLSPCSGCFLASFALGDKAVQAAQQSKLPTAVFKIINDARRYAEGTAVRLQIKSANDISPVKILAAIKLAN